MVRQGESAIRHSRLLVEQMEAEADRSPERRDRLLDAARSVAQATSRMIDATKVLYCNNYACIARYDVETNFAFDGIWKQNLLKSGTFIYRNVKCIHRQLNRK